MALQTLPNTDQPRLDGCALYRYFDSRGVLLYVGISASAARRLADHSKQPWADRIASVTVERLSSRKAALEAEREAIRGEKPAFNIQHRAVIVPFAPTAPEGEVMTPAERQRLFRERVRAGLVRLEFWVPAAAADDVKQAVAQVMAKRGKDAVTGD